MTTPPAPFRAIRATERTVVERIPPRMRVRREAPVELPHILMLADDHEHVLIEPIAEKKDKLEKLYDFDLMEDGGHITRLARRRRGSRCVQCPPDGLYRKRRQEI